MNPMELKKEFGESTLKVVILAIISYGIYYFIWIADRRKKLNELAGKEVFNFNLLIAAAVCLGLSFFIAIIRLYSAGDTGYSIIFSIAYGILIIIIAWNIASFLELYLSQNYKIDVKLNKVLVVIFNIFYINYYFNNLDKIVSEHSKNLENKDDNLSKIEKLAEMKEKGIITEEEFTKKKQELLG